MGGFPLPERNVRPRQSVHGKNQEPGWHTGRSAVKGPHYVMDDVKENVEKDDKRHFIGSRSVFTMFKIID